MHRVLKAAAIGLLGSMVSLASAAGEKPGYDAARWDPIHFKPAIDQATDAQCLVCHPEILDRRVRDISPAGVKASEALAWYQTLTTYAGDQETFHRRHLVTPYARQVMTLKCNTCHQGNDPREETANSSATGDPNLTQRKHVDPNICLMCHGQFSYQLMGLPGPWVEHEQTFGSCLTCHAAIRTHRHQVNFLKAEAIEAAAKDDSDVCYGCHGGRSWYRIAYPYPRHPWSGGGETVPDWARDRPTESDPRFQISRNRISKN
jgi:nitrate/TMAO reductase-like tetraheme cytochrome c subunit